MKWEFQSLLFILRTTERRPDVRQTVRTVDLDSGTVKTPQSEPRGQFDLMASQPIVTDDTTDTKN